MAPIYSSHFCMSSIKPLTGASSCSTNLKWTNNCWFNSCPNWFLLLIRTNLGVCKLFLGTLALAIVWQKNWKLSPGNICIFGNKYEKTYTIVTIKRAITKNIAMYLFIFGFPILFPLFFNSMTQSIPNDKFNVWAATIKWKLWSEPK